jgi:integrase/recombinase XerD
MVSKKGKTGMRPVRIIKSAPYLSNWLNFHLKKDDPECFVWIPIGTMRNKVLKNIKKRGYGLGYSSVLALLKKIAKKAGIKKRANPHAFRHSYLTILANKLTEAQLKKHAGWVAGSQMAQIYVHLSRRDTDDAILEANGIKREGKEKEDDKLKPIKCPRCNQNNEPSNKYCKFCGAALDLKTAIKLDQKENLMTNLIVKLAKTFEKNSKEDIHFEELDYIIQPEIRKNR